MAEENTSNRDDDSFEIEISDGEDTSIEDVYDEAVAAVDRVEKEHGDAAIEAEARAEEAEAQVREAERRLAELEERFDANRDRLARTLADFENYRKRAEREKVSAQRFALFNPMRDFLEVVDNLERALAAEGSAEDLKLGIQMTLRQLETLLQGYGVEKVAALGEVFDPQVHEAVSREESEEVSAPTVVSELQKGYRLHDRLLRPARVSVAMPAASEDTEEDSGVDSSGVDSPGAEAPSTS